MSMRVFFRQPGTMIATLMMCQLALTLYLSFTLNIWVDEYFSLFATEGSMRRAIWQSIHFDSQPPLYYFLLNLWRMGDSSVLFARLFSVISVALATYIIYLLACRLWGQSKVLPFFPILVLNPYLIWAASEIRLYGFLLLECALLMYFFHKAFLHDDRQHATRDRLAFFALSLAILYTQYYAGFLLLAGAFALMVLGRWQELKVYIVGMLVVGILFLPMIGVLSGQVREVSHTASAAVSAPGLTESVKHVYWLLQGLLFPDNGIAGWAAVKDWIVLLLVLYLVYLLVRHKSCVITLPNMYLLTLLFVLAGSFILICWKLGMYYTQRRHLAILFFPLLGLWLGYLCSIKQRWLGWLLLAICMATYANALMYKYVPPVKYGDWERVAGHISSSSHYNAPILVFRNTGALPFSTYFKPTANIIPVPNAFGLDHFDAQSPVLESEQLLIDMAEKLDKSSNHFWLLTYATGSWLGVDIGARFVEQFVETHCTVIEQKKFVGTKVRLVRYNQAR
ncbi:hypothetical protein [Desulfosediminicola sp.]|uniref:hypothetical protein n=1 Tax=Desulfosediminicola sp. TaxID=2886825 RepID=UPI003AF2895A